MCDSCSDFVRLLNTYENKVCKETNDLPILNEQEIDTVFVYLQTWPTRQCMCCYRDPRNLDRFATLTESLILTCVRHLQRLSSSTTPANGQDDDPAHHKLLVAASKTFLLNYPLYVALRHAPQPIRRERLGGEEEVCGAHDADVPAQLLRNVGVFCGAGGVEAAAACFEKGGGGEMSTTQAHAIVAVVCNLKLWMNYKSMVAMVAPLRSSVLRYMCRLSDQELRTATVKSMADFMWNAIREPLDATGAVFDRDGLDLAFKYFASPTLTMRLAGVAQINGQIGALAEACANGVTMGGMVAGALGGAGDGESAPRCTADWLIANGIVGHLFGPNLHVEVIKQSHIILNFLAMENRITREHIDLIWAAAQLKHCAKPVHDLLPGLVKHLAVAPTLHLYNLLKRLEPKEHTEQTLYLASALIKAIWSRSAGTNQVGVEPMPQEGVPMHKCSAQLPPTSTSENSVSLDPSNSDDEHHGDSSDRRSVDSEEAAALRRGLDGEPPCKLARKQRAGRSRRRRDGGSSTDTEIDGVPLKPEKAKWIAVSPRAEKFSKKTLSQNIQKKLASVLPEGIETIASSSSQEDLEDLEVMEMEEDEDDEETHKMRKRRKMLRKTRVKRQKGDDKKQEEQHHETDSEHEDLLPIQTQLMPNVVVEGKEEKIQFSRRKTRRRRHRLQRDSSEEMVRRGEFLALRRTGHILEMLSDEEDETAVVNDEDEDDDEEDEEASYSSRMSNKSEKNMADFDGEDDSVCEEELAQLAERARLEQASPIVGVVERKKERMGGFRTEDVCKPGNTLLWDLLQDDKICQLGEGLALEAEKTLCNLVCYTPDKEIRMKFIEGCLDNLANNTCVIVSLRTLPKLLTSFRGLDMHHVTHWADRQHHMMRHFFGCLRAYASDRTKAPPLYTHQMQVQVRLHFLSAVFSPVVSPNTFKLSIEQVDILWSCLANDPECCDELFSWLLSQTKTTELHALKLDALRRIYTHHLPSLPPESYSMICLGLLQQLCSLDHLLGGGSDDEGSGNVGMDHMWKIALKADNTDVSMAAIQYITSSYMGRNLRNERRFVAQCMTNLRAAAADLHSSTSQDASLLCIQRALLLMKTHIETFFKRYAYHLRKWALEGRGIISHAPTTDRQTVPPIRLIVQSGSSSEKCVFEMQTGDLVAELRAEVVKWCVKGDGSAGGGEEKADPWIRIITQGQELPGDCDEKTLGEMGFKDNQVVYVSAGASRSTRRRDHLDCPSARPAPPRDSLPTLLLLQPDYFEQLFALMRSLSCMKMTVKGGRRIPHTKAQVLSRRVWDILNLMPTSPELLHGFRHLDRPLHQLLDPSSAQRLMYSLSVVEALAQETVPIAKETKEIRKKKDEEEKETKKVNEDEEAIVKLKEEEGKEGNGEKEETVTEDWSSRFVKYGGLRHLFDIFMSGVLQRDCEEDSDWRQDCLASLLKTLCRLGVTGSVNRSALDGNKTNQVSVVKKELLELMVVDRTMAKLCGILEEASRPRDPGLCRTGVWGRAQVVHYAMALLVPWLHCSEEARQGLFESSNFADWLKRLILDDPEPAVRRETCSAVYRLCVGNGNGNGLKLAGPVLAKLLNYLDCAEGMRPQKPEMNTPDDGKEPYGPACRDYFWLVARLIDELPSSDEDNQAQIDIEALTRRVSRSLIERDFLESRHRTVDDDGLVGLLTVAASLARRRPAFRTDGGGQELIDQVFDFLFALPNPKLRHVPKCKSARARTAAFDLLVELVKGCPENYDILHEKLLKQHQPGPHSPYPWDYWPHDDGRADCGYVGLANLGATCYMASCMQHLYMMPAARASILAADHTHARHGQTLREMQRMFAYLLESERKAYNPRGFCKVYTMDHQPLNTAEQKDMAEFFIDLVSKLEEMTPDLKRVVKSLFCGVITNNVVSLDCEHVSRTLEEFYTVRCQVADMRNLYESLDEVTVKDTLEGDNMYTCSQCGKKVRAEKRACFKKLPNILCFNTMRYTFNMLTMLKEKVNTHFSFPLRLNMNGYVDHHQESTQDDEQEPKGHEYDLIGVTVHTGTADGGHYYSFIKDRMQEKWFLFNDAEVKPFDPQQIATECFGGEMTSKTYDSVADKFMDFSFEKTNSAYMLFYERCTATEEVDVEVGSSSTQVNTSVTSTVSSASNPVLSPELEDWIWRDNMHFIQDKNIFEHTYFNFMWQMCGHIPQTLLSSATAKAAELSTTFFIETFIHAKEKPTMVQWVELVTKQFNACPKACEWFLDHMAKDTWWPVQVLLKCPNQMVRQMFQRLCMHVVQRLRQTHSCLYPKTDQSEPETADRSTFSGSCVTRFIKTLLSLMEHGAKSHPKHLTEYFGFLYEFSKMGEDETKFLLASDAISTMVHFYLGQGANDFVDVSDGDDEDEAAVSIAAAADKYKPASLDKMITLIASLVEKSRDSAGKLQLSEKDYNAVAGGKGFAFLHQQIRDNINLQQTRNLIHSLCKSSGGNALAQSIICMVSQAIARHSEACQPFFKMLTLLTEGGSTGAASGSTSQPPCFTQLVLQKVWEAAECCPYSALDWLALQVTRNRLVHQWVLSSVDSWLEHFLIAHNNQRVRTAAGYLLVSLVPSSAFRQGFRATHRMQREPQLGADAQSVLHQVYGALLRLLAPAKHYTETGQHGTTKLTTYFALLMYCCVSRAEKLMFGQYFVQLWYLFHPKLSEPSIPAYHNKQALLAFWNHACTDCPENVQLMLQNGHVTKNIAFNYILADHDDQEIVMFNRAMLPAYYGLLRMMCQQSRVFTRNLAQHQNLQWAFKNITPHPTQYPQAVEELFKLMQLMIMKHPDATEAEQREICNFRRTTLMTYLQCLDGRTSWGTLISAFRILLETNDDKLYVVYNGGLQIVFECFQNLHVMLHEATACHVCGDLLDVLSILQDLIRAVRTFREAKDARALLLATKDWPEVIRKLATLLNTYNPQDVRTLSIDVLKEFVLTTTPESLQVLVPLLYHCHTAYQESQDAAVPLGPYFPRRGHTQVQSTVVGKGAARPLRPMVQMTVPHNQLECARGVDPNYDAALDAHYAPYHSLIDVLFRLAVNADCVVDSLVGLSAIVGFEAVPLHSVHFPKLWLDVLRAQNIDRKYITMLSSNSYFVDYVDAVLLDERSSLAIDPIYEFLVAFFPKVSNRVLTERTLTTITAGVQSLIEHASTLELCTNRLAGDVRALALVYGSEDRPAPPQLPLTLNRIRGRIGREMERVNGESKSDEKKEEASTSKGAATKEAAKADDLKRLDRIVAEVLDVLNK